MALRPSVEIEIGELVLHGFAPGARAPLAHALTAELQYLLSDSPALAARLDAHRSFVAAASAVPLRPEQPAAVGAAVARAVVGGWGR